MRAGSSQRQDRLLRPAIRLGFAAIALLWALVNGRVLPALPWVALVTGLDLATTWRLRESSSQRARADGLAMLMTSAGVSGVAYALLYPSTAPLVLVSAYHGGLVLGRRAVAYVVGTAALAEGATVVLDPRTAVDHQGELAWILAATVLVLLGAWSRHLSLDDELMENHAAREATALLHRLTEIADESRTGFDAPALGDELLDTLASVVACERCVIVVGSPDRPVPIAMHGVTRLPWGPAGDEDSALERAWQDVAPRSITIQENGRPRALLTVPLRSSDDTVLGVLAADRPTPYAKEELIQAERAVRAASPLLEASILFAGLRERAALEERSRLAREMHDGVAQDLAALAYHADVVRQEVAHSGSGAVAELDALRDAIRSTVRDVRLHIADLRMIERPGRSLGTLLGTALQVLAGSTNLHTTLALHESGYRFPADVELQIYRLAQRVFDDVRSATDATSLSMDVRLSPPSAVVSMRHDGHTRLREEDFTQDPLVRHGAHITVTTTEGAAPLVSLSLGDPDQAATTHEEAVQWV